MSKVVQRGGSIRQKADGVEEGEMEAGLKDEEAEAQTADGKRHTDSGRPRQLAVPYRNYRRYRM